MEAVRDAEACVEPWDDRELRDECVAVALSLPREPFLKARPPRSPGVYVHLLTARDDRLLSVRDGEAPLPALGAVGTGRVPFYVGSAADLHARALRYKTAWGWHAELMRALSVVHFPTRSWGSALLAEQLLIEGLQPVGLGTGWGNKRPGAGRPGGTASAARLGLPRANSVADALFYPGRSWAATVSSIERVSAQLHVLSHLARLDPRSPRWRARA